MPERFASKQSLIFNNIGIRLVAGISTIIDYYNNAGINTLILKVD